jgi:hypothetical protein
MFESDQSAPKTKLSAKIDRLARLVPHHPEVARTQRLAGGNEQGGVGLGANETLEMINHQRHDATRQAEMTRIAVLGQSDAERSVVVLVYGSGSFRSDRAGHEIDVLPSESKHLVSPQGAPGSKHHRSPSLPVRPWRRTEGGGHYGPS